jgi:hypothetical protein
MRVEDEVEILHPHEMDIMDIIRKDWRIFRLIVGIPDGVGGACE